MKKITFVALAFSLLTAIGCRTTAGGSGLKILSTTAPRPQIMIWNLESPAVADNTIGSPAQVSLTVVTPKDYETSTKRYPVIYFLHGFRSSPNEVLRWVNLLNDIGSDGKEFILVGVEGKNSLQGGFFVNSPVSGRWEDWLVREAVPFIDMKLRTLPAAASRGLLGMSMGGFSVLHNGLKYPNVFSAVYAIAPGVFEPQTGLRAAMKSWADDPQFVRAYGAAFAGDLDKRPLFDGSPEDNALVNSWESGFGGWVGRVDSYLAGAGRLTAIGIEWGSNDFYRWILVGSAALVEYLSSRGIQVESEVFLGGHDIMLDRIADVIFPFFQQNLSF